MKNFARLGVLAAVFAVAATVAQAADVKPEELAARHKAPFTVGVSNGYLGNTWRAQFVEDLQSVANDLKAAGDFKRIDIVNSTSGTAGQIAQINSLINGGVSALVINPVSGEALKPVITRAISAGILVVIADDPLEHPGVVNVVLDQGQFARAPAQWMVDTLKGKGNIVSIDGLAGNTANDWRIRARNEVLQQHPDIKQLSATPAGWDPAKAREVMTSQLSAHPDIDGVLIQDVMAEGVVRAYESAGKPLPPMSGDYLHSFLKIWKEKKINAFALANPPGIGADALRVAAALLRGHKLKSGALGPNPFDPKLVNTIIIPEPIAISLEGDKTKPWCTEATECISVDEALTRLKGKPDSASLDSFMTDAQTLERYFQ